MMFLNCNSF